MGLHVVYGNTHGASSGSDPESFGVAWRPARGCAPNTHKWPHCHLSSSLHVCLLRLQHCCRHVSFFPIHWLHRAPYHMYPLCQAFPCMSATSLLKKALSSLILPHNTSRVDSYSIEHGPSSLAESGHQSHVALCDLKQRCWTRSKRVLLVSFL